MKLTTIADQIIKTLLFLAIVVFAAVLLIYAASLIGIQLPFSDKLIPDSLLSTLIPPLTIITVYELVRLAVAIQASLVEFIRTLFQVVSVIIISDLLKNMAKLPGDNLDLIKLSDPGMLLAASILLYFFIELLERRERRVLNSKHPKITPHLAPYRKVFAWGLLVYVVSFSAYTAAALITGWPHTQYLTEFLRLILAGFVIVNVFILLIALFFVKTYETLFEFFALVLASVMVFFALPLQALPKIVIVFAALFFSIATLSLHGYSRSDASDGGSEI